MKEEPLFFIPHPFLKVVCSARKSGSFLYGNYSTNSAAELQRGYGSPPLPPTYRRIGTTQVGNPQSGDDGRWQQETLMLLETLRMRDPDELAEESASQQIGLTLLDESGVIRKCRGVNPQ
jgi:hypothetical protein